MDRGKKSSYRSQDMSYPRQEPGGVLHAYHRFSASLGAGKMTLLIQFRMQYLTQPLGQLDNLVHLRGLDLAPIVGIPRFNAMNG